MLPSLPCLPRLHTTLRLTTHIYHLTIPVDEEFGHGLAASSTLESLTRLKSRCLQGLGAHPEGQLGKNPLLNSHGYRQNSVPRGLLDWRSQFLADR